jgi:uncharacterized protein (DUF488 family)
LAHDITSALPPVVWTIGHSTRSGDEFVALLKAHGIATVADVRSIPRSRRHPQFNSETLAAALERDGIAYVHLPALGGLRRPRPDSPNAGWRNEGFRGYADHMQTPEFAAALTALERLAAASRVTVMCAEAVPWRCHRSLLADALVARGVEVRHITGTSAPSPHVLTPFARVEGGRVAYPPAQPPLPLSRRRDRT